jgi:mRNA interferase MazF
MPCGAVGTLRVFLLYRRTHIFDAYGDAALVSVTGAESRGGSRVVWLVHDSGYVNIADGYARRAFGPSRYGCPTCGRQNLSRKLTASRLPSPPASMRPTTKRSSMRSPSTGPPPRGVDRLRRGDIHIAAARGAYAGKPRPVVIVQDDRFDATSSVTVCPLTPNPVESPLTRIAVQPTPVTGTEQPSHIMVHKITTMPRANVRDHLGRLADADLIRLDCALLVFLGLAE